MVDERPIARTYERDVFQRQAACDDPVHGGMRTTAFVGVNATGWIFKYPGHGYDTVHLFLALPPADTAALNQVDPGGSE
jgi:hypothetical protein